MAKGTTAPGFVNQNGQTVVRATGLHGTDHNQKIYVLRCDVCGVSYGANGSDIHIRKCPNCGGGKPGLPFDAEGRDARPVASGWAAAEAKARFSEVVEKASISPQTITRNGRPVAVIVGFDEWQSKTRRKGSLAEFFLNSPLRGSNLDLERAEIEPRDVQL